MFQIKNLVFFKLVVRLLNVAKKVPKSTNLLNSVKYETITEKPNKAIKLELKNSPISFAKADNKSQ